MRHMLVMLCCMFLWTGDIFAAAAEEIPAGRTLSPYFFVEGEDSGVDSFPLKSTMVDVAITGVIADVTVKQVYANMGGQTINGRYIFPASTNAAVHGMKMIIGERVIQAVIREKEAARKTFETAKREGRNASLLEQQRPNVFSMEVANIMPGDSIEVELRYTELLVPVSGTYEFVYPTVVGPRYSTMPAKGGNNSEAWVENPYLKEGTNSRTSFAISVFVSAGMKLQELNCSSHDTTISYQDESRALVDLTDPAVFAGDRDYILRYRLADLMISSGLLLEKGDKENFFLLMAQPPEKVTPEKIISREYSFVVDVSGSMHGFPLDTAKRLLEDLISSLKPTDSFNVLLFAGGSQVMSETPVPATPEQVRRAIGMIENSDGGGGTELLKAMRRAMAMDRREGVSRTMVVVTDGYINAEKEVFKEIRNNLDHTNVFAFGIGSSVNRYLIEGIARSGQGEPFIVTGPDQARQKAQRFREYISSPVLTDIKIDFAGVDVFDVEPPATADLFAARPVIVFGKWKGAQDGSIELSGMSGAGEFKRSFSFEDTSVENSSRGLGYLWARSRIARISDYNSGKGNPEKREQIVALGLAYNLLTAFTSFVAVDEVVRNPDGSGTDIKQPLPLAKGLSNRAVSGGMKRVPEPEIFFLVLILIAGVLIGNRHKKQFLACLIRSLK